MASATDRNIDQSLADIREVAGRQLPGLTPAPVDAAAMVRFSPDLPARLEEDQAAALVAEAAKLEPWLQGPFFLGGDLVIGGTWRTDQRWVGLGAQVPESLAGMRVLDIGSNAGYDCFMFKHRGAEYVLGCEPHGFIAQARFLESIYKSGADFRQIGWQQLSPTEHGQFDLVHCNGVLYHEPNPVLTLQALRRMLRPGGLLVLGTMTLADVELSELARFVPDTYFGDPSWWWVPGRMCVRWMLEATGFVVEYEFGHHPGPPGEFQLTNCYFRAVAGEANRHLGGPTGLPE